MKRAWSPLLLTALAACSTTLSPDARYVQDAGAGGMVTMPLQTMAERRFATVIRQQYDFSCGSAALATLLRYHHGDPVDEKAVFQGMWAKGDRAQIRRLGFSLLDMKRYLEARGMKADGYRVPLDTIASTGAPGIALIAVKNYRHFVVVKGVSATEVLIGDPSIGIHPMTREAFEASWNGVYFVLSDEAAKGEFNRDAQWASFSRAPLGGSFIDPLSLQALSLTAPFYRDF